MLIIFKGGNGMAGSYGDLIRRARKAQSPPITAKQLADKLKVSAPFITDIEKNRRLPSLQNQEKIKILLACEEFPGYMFDDLAAADNEDPRVVAEDLAKDIRKESALRELIRVIRMKELTPAQIAALTTKIGGDENGK